MKKLIIVLLTILLTASVCSCGTKMKTPKSDTVESQVQETADNSADTEEPTAEDEKDFILAGQWICPLSAEHTVAINGQSLETIMGGFTPEQVGCTSTMNVYLNFKPDGTATFTQKGSELDATMLDLYTSFYEYISDYEIASELYDMDSAHLDYNAHEQYGVTTWPEAMQQVIENMKKQAEESPTGDAVSEIFYTLEGDTLTLTYLSDNTTEVYNLNGNTLTCISTDNFTGDPAVFTYKRILTEDLLAGRWSSVVAIEGLEESFNLSLADSGTDLASLGITVPENLTTTYVMEFTNDGKVTQSVEAPEYFEFLNSFYDAYANYLSDPAIFASLYYENGIEDLNLQAEKNNMTVEEFMADELEYIRSTDETLMAQLSETVSGSYTIEEDTLTVSSDTDKAIYEYKNGTLITEYIDSELIFTKN